MSTAALVTPPHEEPAASQVVSRDEPAASQVVSRDEPAASQVVSRDEPAAALPSSGIHPVEDGPIDPAFALFDEVFGPGSGDAHRRRFDWQYRHGGLGDGAKLWLFWHQGRPIGSLGLLPATLYIEGRAHPAKFTADLGSAPAYRNRGIGARLMQAFLKADGLSLAFGVSDDARALLTRMGFQEVPGLVPMFRVLSFQALVRRRFPIPMSAAWAGPPVDRLLELVDLARPIWSPLAEWAIEVRRGIRPPIASRLFGGAVQISWPTAFPAALNGLAERLSLRWAITFSPDQHALTRRYAQHPFHRYLIEVAQRDGEVVGYAVWRMFAEPDGLKMGILSTLQVLPGDDAALDALLNAGLERLARAGAFAVKTLASTPYQEEALRRHLFFPHGSSPGLFYHTTDDLLRQRLNRPWRIDLGTSDVDVG